MNRILEIRKIIDSNSSLEKRGDESKERKSTNSDHTIPNSIKISDSFRHIQVNNISETETKDPPDDAENVNLIAICHQTTEKNFNIQAS